MKCFGYVFVVLCLSLTCSGQSPTTAPTLNVTEGHTALPTTITKVEVDTGNSSDASTTNASITTSTKNVPTTSVPTNTTVAPQTTTIAPTSIAPTSIAPTSIAPSTNVPTTNVPTTNVPTTNAPTTNVPTTNVPTTNVPTTTETPTTTAAPAPPSEDPATNSYDLNDTSTHFCLLAEMGITLSFNLTNSTGASQMFTYNLPNTTTINRELSSNCSAMQNSTSQNLVLEFADSGNSLTLTFTKDKDVTLSELTFVSPNASKIFPGAKEGKWGISKNVSMFAVSSGFYYLCNSESKSDLQDGNSISFKHVKLEAFVSKSDNKFSSNAKQCDQDMNDVNNIVPIAVGCALAGLVVIVLIAYLVGRRQKRQRGYESV